MHTPRSHGPTGLRKETSHGEKWFVRQSSGSPRSSLDVRSSDEWFCPSVMFGSCVHVCCDDSFGFEHVNVFPLRWRWLLVGGVVSTQPKMIRRCDIDSISTNSSIQDVESTAICPQNRQISVDSMSKRQFSLSI